MLFRKVAEVQRPCCCPKKKSFLLEGELCTCSLHITFSVFIWNCNLKNQLFICFKEKFGTVLPIQKKKTLLEKKKKKFICCLSATVGIWGTGRKLCYSTNSPYITKWPYRCSPLLHHSTICGWSKGFVSMCRLKCPFETPWLLQRRQHQALG